MKLVLVITLSIMACSQATHNTNKCNDKYRDLRQQVASVHLECGDANVYSCCEVRTILLMFQ